MSHAESCWHCKYPLDAVDRYCRHCGNGQGRFLHWYYQPLWIAVLTVTALGPLILFLVWRTPRLGQTSRWIATVIIVGMTVYLGHQLWQTLRVFHSLLGSIS
jgi:hypothetical protein